jgi:hypothetical protein
MHPGYVALIAAIVTGAVGVVAVMVAVRIARARAIVAGREQATEFYRRWHEVAIHTFILRLENLIVEPYDTDFVHVRAQAIVDFSDSIQMPLMSLSSALDLHASRLKATLAGVAQRPDDPMLKAELGHVIERLRETWPSRRHALAVALREFLPRLGYMNYELPPG